MPRSKKLSTVEISKTRQGRFKFVTNSYDPEGKRSRAFFSTRNEAEAHRTLRLQEFSVIENQNLVILSEDEKLAVRLARKNHLDLLKTVRSGVDAAERIKAAGAAVDVKTSELLKRWLTQLENIGRGSRYRNGVENFMTTVIGKWGDPTVDSINADLVGLIVHGNAALSNTTRQNYRTMLHSFFAFAVDQGIILENPAAKVKAPRSLTRSDDPIGILTAEQSRALLAAVALVAPALLPAVAVGLFAGLRHAELHRLAWSDISLDRGLIVVTAGKAKTKNRRMITIQPPLSAILNAAPRPVPKLVWPTNGEKLWDRALKSAGWRGRIHWPPAPLPHAPEWPDNALRHSFVSYHVAMFKDAALTALESGHSPDVLFRHYRQLVTEDDAGEFWSVRLENP